MLFEAKEKQSFGDTCFETSNLSPLKIRGKFVCVIQSIINTWHLLFSICVSLNEFILDYFDQVAEYIHANSIEVVLINLG